MKFLWVLVASASVLNACRTPQPPQAATPVAASASVEPATRTEEVEPSRRQVVGEMSELMDMITKIVRRYPSFRSLADMPPEYCKMICDSSEEVCDLSKRIREYDLEDVWVEYARKRSGYQCGGIRGQCATCGKPRKKREHPKYMIY